MIVLNIGVFCLCIVVPFVTGYCVGRKKRKKYEVVVGEISNYYF